jgi:hypothetical protein
MLMFEWILLLLFAVVVLTNLAEQLAVPYPYLLAVAGTVFAFLRFAPSRAPKSDPAPRSRKTESRPARQRYCQRPADPVVSIRFFPTGSMCCINSANPPGSRRRVMMKFSVPVYAQKVPQRDALSRMRRRHGALMRLNIWLPRSAWIPAILMS